MTIVTLLFTLGDADYCDTILHLGDADCCDTTLHPRWRWLVWHYSSPLVTMTIITLLFTRGDADSDDSSRQAFRQVTFEYFC